MKICRDPVVFCARFCERQAKIELHLDLYEDHEKARRLPPRRCSLARVPCDLVQGWFCKGFHVSTYYFTGKVFFVTPSSPVGPGARRGLKMSLELRTCRKTCGESPGSPKPGRGTIVFHVKQNLFHVSKALCRAAQIVSREAKLVSREQSFVSCSSNRWSNPSKWPK